MKHLLTFLLAACVVCLMGCAAKKKHNDAQEMRKATEAEGWEFLEYVGTPVDDAAFSRSATSNGGIIYAQGTTGGTAVSKEYTPNQYFYQTLTFDGKDNASYSMVFRKKR